MSAHEDGNEEKVAPLSVACPRCGAAVGVSCLTYNRRHFMQEPHTERVAVAQGLPGKENRHSLTRLGWGQRRADPTLTVRRLEDEEAA